MSGIHVICSFCGHKLQTNLSLDELRGRPITCPKCMKPIQVESTVLSSGVEHRHEHSATIDLDSVEDSCQEILFLDDAPRGYARRLISESVRRFRKIRHQPEPVAQPASNVVKVFCSNCGQKLKTDKSVEELARRAMSCPRCKSPIRIDPAAYGSAAPAPAASADTSAYASAVIPPAYTPSAAPAAPVSVPVQAPAAARASGPVPVPGVRRNTGAIPNPGVRRHTGVIPNPALAKNAEAAPARQKKEPTSWLIPVAVGVVLLVGLSFVLAMALRDTWERDYYSRMIRMSDDVVTATDATTMSRKFDELQGFVGNRQLQNQELIAAFSKAKEATLAAQKRAQEMKTLTLIVQLESDAKTLTENFDYEKAKEKFQQVQVLIAKTPTGNPEFAAAGARAAQGIESLTAEIRKTSVEKVKPGKDAAKAVGAAAKVSGAVWVTTKPGLTRTLKRIEVCALPRATTKVQLLNAYRVARQCALGQVAYLEESKPLRVQEDANRAAEASFKYLKSLPPALVADPELQRVNFLEKTELELKRIREAEETTAQVKVDVLAKAQTSVEAMREDETLDQMLVNNLFLSDTTDKEREAFYMFCSPQIVSSSQTDVEGFFEMKLPEGQYYLLAEDRNDMYEARWFLPVEVKGDATVRVDLHNKNACWIKIKEDAGQ